MKSLHKYIFSVHTAKRCVIYLAISFVSGLYGQNLDLQNFTLNENAKIDSVVFQFQAKDKLKFLSLFPNVNYNFETGFSVGFSLSNFISFSQTRKRNKIEAMKIKNNLKDKLQQKLEKARIEKEEILLLKDETFLNILVLKNRYELYQIAFIQHTKNEITFSEYTTKKINYLEKYNTTFKKIKQLKIKLLRYFQNYNVNLFDTKELLTNIKTYEIAN